MRKKVNEIELFSLKWKVQERTLKLPSSELKAAERRSSSPRGYNRRDES